jgi:hypothetical protein
MFVTFGGVRIYNNNQIELILAEHPPIMRIDKNGNFEELKITHLVSTHLPKYSDDISR